MELKTYDREIFDRSKIRYILFTCIFVIVIVTCIFTKNIGGVVFIFFILGAYIYFGIINIHEITLKITDEGLLSDRLIPRNQITGYCLEVEIGKDKKIKKIKNIVIITVNGHEIYTISDTQENLGNFSKELSNRINMLDNYPQSFREKISRKIKL